MAKPVPAWNAAARTKAGSNLRPIAGAIPQANTPVRSKETAPAIRVAAARTGTDAPATRACRAFAKVAAVEETTPATALDRSNPAALPNRRTAIYPA